MWKELVSDHLHNRGVGIEGGVKKKKQLKELLLPQDSLPQGQVIEAEISQLQQNL